MPGSLSLEVDAAHVRVYYSPEVTRGACRLHMDSCGRDALTVVLPERGLGGLSLVLDVGKAEPRDTAARMMTVSSNVGEVIACNITVLEPLEASTNVGRVALKGVYMPEDAVAPAQRQRWLGGATPGHAWRLDRERRG